MKAAILHQAGDIPKYEDFSVPAAQNDHELPIKVTAASIKNLDKMRASGSHYDAYTTYPVIAGVDGVGILEDGTRVYASSKTGMMAEKTTVLKSSIVTLPAQLDDITAAAIANPAISAWLSLEFKGKLQKGGSVLIVGATGITGSIAVQLAKHMGAARIVVMGRNPVILEKLRHQGADIVISLAQSDEAVKAAVQAEKSAKPFDIVLDYLWGKYAEMILDVLTGHDLNAASHLTRYVQVGEMTGATINLKAAVLRSSFIEILGVGGGSIPLEVMKQIPSVILPAIFQLAAEGKLSIDTEVLPLSDVEAAWQKKDIPGKRIVLTIP